MEKGNFKDFIKGKTAHRVPKLATLAVTATVLIALINIDASASSFSHLNGGSRSTGTATSTFAASLSDLSALGRSHGPGHSGSPSTTTTDPVATADPVTTTTEPATTADPTTTTTEPATTTTDPTTTTTADSLAFPIGTPDSSEPSGYAPPAANALPGYTQTFVTDFPGSSIPSGWDIYSGTPGSDPGGQFGGANHIQVSGGVLSLLTYEDPNYGGEWVTGGLSTNISQTYGADFVRSRVTGAGPTMVELLWPADNQWPPEIDFAESDGGTNELSATVHWASGGTDHQDQRVLDNIDLTQWNTWGVIWTPTSITYTVNGQVWGQVTTTSEIPDIPMTLDLQQQTWCGASPAWACPSGPQQMEIDWVAEYTAN